MSLGVILTLIFLFLLWQGMVTWPLWVIFLPIVVEIVIDVLLLLWIIWS